jgi:hypothetical protein
MEMIVRRWFGQQLAMLIAAYYAVVVARAIAALPHDELDATF